ncbi:MAG: ABC transporter permease [Propionibacteriaceae bacterium]|nr:ABC transporter permease [Propionibacteriaceae bacterium]
MLRHALAEVRLHPGRYLSTLLAIAISVAFLAGAPVVVNTQAYAEAMKLSAPVSKADAVASGTDQASASRLTRVDGVAAASPLTQWAGVVRDRTGDYTILGLLQLPPESLRWTTLRSGMWPTTKDEVVLDETVAARLGIELGRTLRTQDGTAFRLVGLSAGPGSSEVSGFLAPSFFVDIDPGTWIFRAAPGISQQMLADRLKAAAGSTDVTVQTGTQAVEEAITNATRGVEAFTYVLWGFAGVALVVGMITVANTFTITMAQRRRQIGLLRAVGASGRQLRTRFAWEALLLGTIGSVAGVLLGVGLAAVVAAVLGSLGWGLSLPWLQLVLALVVGTSATVAASWVPIVRSTRVAPLEALQPVATSEQALRASRVRAVVCGGLVLLGAAAVVLSLNAGSNSFFVAIAAGALLALGVLFGAPLFVPSLLKAAGRGLRGAGPVAALAADNAERNPRRAAATATALMLAIGLMVTLQVATASMKATTLAEIQEHYPVDLSVTWLTEQGKPATVPDATRQRLLAVPGVAASAELAATAVTVDEDSPMTLIGWDAAIEKVTTLRPSVGDDVVLVSPFAFSEKAKTVTVKGTAGKLTLTIVRSRLVGPDQAMVSAKTLARIGKPVPAAVIWLSVPDRGRAISVSAQVTDIVGTGGRIDGSIITAAQTEQVVNVLLAITTGLLGVAVLIALIGVSNTLGLSVMERTRESALLRALGLQARSLRVMLMIEAVQVALVGVVVGVLAGGFFGWLAVSSLGRSGDLAEVRFAVDVPQTLGMVAIAVLAAALASVLPGRRAAKASPTEALADV